MLPRYLDLRDRLRTGGGFIKKTGPRTYCLQGPAESLQHYQE